MPAKRRSRSDCLPMPLLLGLDHVQDVLRWPMGQIMTSKAAGSGWTDCIVVLVDSIRLGGSSMRGDRNCRRVRYDGRLYISYSKVAGGRVYLDGGLTATALEYVTHVYGIDAESDKMHNATLKGY